MKYICFSLDILIFSQYHQSNTKTEKRLGENMTIYIQPYPYRRQSNRISAINGGSTGKHQLGVNIRDEEDAFVLHAQVPGLKASDLNIQILDGVVRIDGEYQQDQDQYLLRELPAGSFHRVLRLPSDIDTDRVEAKINDGLLTLRLPKAESALPKKIKIAVK
jgi:HSP20 family protein